MSEQIKHDIRLPWTGVFLDGRNEHGTHVLPLPQGMIGEFEPQDHADEIMQAAEAAGHVSGDAVVCVCRYVEGDFSEGGFPPYWDLVTPYHADLTALVYGTPTQQMIERTQSEKSLVAC